MRKRWVIYLGAAMLAGAMGGALLGPAPVGAVAREIVELQQSVNQLIQGQQTMQTAITQNARRGENADRAVLDSVNKLNGTMDSTAEDRAGYAGDFRRAPGHHVHAGPGRLR